MENLFRNTGVFNHEVALCLSKEYSLSYDEWQTFELESLKKFINKKGDLSTLARVLVSRIRGEKEYHEVLSSYFPSKSDRGLVSTYVERVIGNFPNGFYRKFCKDARKLQSEYDEAIHIHVKETLSYLIQVRSDLNISLKKAEQEFANYLANRPLQEIKGRVLSEEELITGGSLLAFNDELDTIIEYAVTSFLELLVYKKQFKLFRKYIEKYSYFILPEFCGHYVAYFHYFEERPPVELFSKMFIGRGGTSKFASKRNLEAYLELNSKSVLSKQDQYILTNNALKSIENRDPNWFETFLENDMKKSKYKLKLIKSSNYRYGLFNYSKWGIKEDRVEFPDGHIFKNNYPLFYWDAGGDPVEYYFYKYNEISREIKNYIRDILGLPSVGAGKVRETQVFQLIEKHLEIPVLREYSPSFLGRMRYDFYLPTEKIAIEWNGEQHYRPVDFFGGKEGFKKTQERDRVKEKLSKANGVKFIVLKYDMSDEDVVSALKKQGLPIKKLEIKVAS